MLVATDGTQSDEAPNGYIDYKRFTIRFYLGKDEEFEQTYLDINDGDAIISGISPYSIYKNSL